MSDAKVRNEQIPEPDHSSSAEYRACYEERMHFWKICVNRAEEVKALQSELSAARAEVERVKLERDFIKQYLNHADTSFRDMVDGFMELDKETQSKLINLSQSLADLAGGKNG